MDSVKCLQLGYRSDILFRMELDVIGCHLRVIIKDLASHI